MMTLAVITGIFTGVRKSGGGGTTGVPKEFFEKLCDIYPEGRGGSKGHSFTLQLPLDDLRTKAVLELLDSEGMQPWNRQGKRQRETEFKLYFRRIYDDADLDVCEWLELVPTESVGDSYRDGPGIGPIMIDRPLQAPIGFAHTPTWVLVRDDFKSVLESAGLRGIHFEPTKLRFDPSKFGLTEAEAKCWELRSGITLPSVSPSMTLLHNDHTPFTGDFTLGCHRREGFYLHPELHYRREDMDNCEPCDLAHTYEMFQGGSVPNNYNKPLVASKRFYQICKQHHIKTGWVPVRIDN